MMTKKIEGSFPEDSTEEDCISREAAIEIIENWLSYGDYNEGE